MVQRLHLTVEVGEGGERGGEWEARCPELSLTAKGGSADEAVDRLKELVFSSMIGGFDSAAPGHRAPDPVRAILATNAQCYLHVPPARLVH